MSAGGQGGRGVVARTIVLLLCLTLLTPADAVGLAPPLPVEPGAVLDASPVTGAEPGDVPIVGTKRACRLPPSGRDRRRLRGIDDSRPRVLADASDIMRTRRLSRRDPVAEQSRADLRAAADRLVGLAPTPYRKVGPRLQFFAYKNRILTLALAWRLEGDPRYAAQAQIELLAAAAYPDWNPGHYLDTAEMTAATALGYDWFADVLRPAARRRIRRAIVNKGLRTSLCSYRRGEGPVVQTSNWGIVTNTGMAMGAVAVADTHPRLAAAVLGQALRRVRAPMWRYRADGSYPEGPGYWRYATEHAVKLQATLRSAFGRDFGLGDISGFARTGNYPLRALGPTGKVANFGNAAEELGNTAHLYWLARRFGRPVDAWLARRLQGQVWSPLHLLWYSPRQRAPRRTRFPASAVSGPLQTAFLRSGWSDPGAAFVALKGGANAATHAQPELGAFIYDVRGIRWALDLGLDNYNLPGYFDPKRSKSYYRLATQGQNTLTVDGRTQPHDATARVVRFRRTGQGPRSVVDLSRAYPLARRVRRGVALLGESLLVQDEVAARKRVMVRWGMHTAADVTLSADRRTATLRQDGETVVARLLRPGGGRFAVVSAEQRAPQARNAGIVRLQVRTRTNPKATRRSRSRLRTVVLLAPAGSQRRPEIRPLRRW